MISHDEWMTIYWHTTKRRVVATWRVLSSPVYLPNTNNPSWLYTTKDYKLKRSFYPKIYRNALGMGHNGKSFHYIDIDIMYAQWQYQFEYWQKKVIGRINRHWSVTGQPGLWPSKQGNPHCHSIPDDLRHSVICEWLRKTLVGMPPGKAVGIRP